MKIKDIISSYRAEHKLTMEEFANRSKLTKGYISMLERGAKAKSGKEIVPSLEALGNIAKAMGMSLNDLLNILDDMPVSINSGLKQEETTEEPILTAEELDLLECFRSLNEADKHGVLNFAKYLKGNK